MTRNTRLILGIVIGLIVAVGLFCLAVCISCSVTGSTFSQQIVDWFTKKNANDDAVKGTIDAINLSLKLIK